LPAEVPSIRNEGGKSKLMIKIENIKKEFATDGVVTKVLHGISLDIQKGEFVAIMGASGSGKSTLMHILGLLDRASSGKYLFENKSIANLDDDSLASLRNNEIGFVFQSFNLLPRTTVLENVMLPLNYVRDVKKKSLLQKSKKGANRFWQSDWMRDQARKVLTSVGLSHRLDYYTNQISGGEKQRVAIARALVNHPSIVFADEPTGNLDSKSGIGVMRILQDLNQKGNTIILVTHETFTAEHAKRIIKMRDGLIVSDKKVHKQKIAHEGDLLK